MRNLVLITGVIALSAIVGQGARAAVFVGEPPALERSAHVLTVDDHYHRHHHVEVRRHEEHHRDYHRAPHGY